MMQLIPPHSAISVSGDTSGTITQDVTLLPNTFYAASFQFAALNVDNTLGTTNYQIRVLYGGQPIATLRLSSTDNSWVSGDVAFTTPAAPQNKDGTTPFAIELSREDVVQCVKRDSVKAKRCVVGEVGSATVGIDSFTISNNEG